MRIIGNMFEVKDMKGMKGRWFAQFLLIAIFSAPLIGLLTNNASNETLSVAQAIAGSLTFLAFMWLLISGGFVMKVSFFHSVIPKKEYCDTVNRMLPSCLLSFLLMLALYIAQDTLPTDLTSARLVMMSFALLLIPVILCVNLYWPKTSAVAVYEL